MTDRSNVKPLLANFLEQLFSGRPLGLGAARPVLAAPADAVLESLTRFETPARLEFAGQPPVFDDEAAAWAAAQFYNACSFAVFRDVSGDVVEDAMAGECPHKLDASTVYSVDLVFRYLPDLVQRAKAVSPADPLVAGLRRWAAEWPLSSVGVSLQNPNHEGENQEGEEPTDTTGDQLPQYTIAEENLEPILNHPSLLQAYVDRIIANRAFDRLSSSLLVDKVRAAIGLHPELAPEMARWLETHAVANRSES